MTDSASKQNDPQNNNRSNSVIFPDVNADQVGTTVDSLCLICHQSGETMFLLTKVPHFKEIIISSFNCSHCGFKNSSVQFGGAIHPKGVRWILDVKSKLDADRQVIKADDATIRVPELDLEIPPLSQRGTLSTVEGVLRQTSEALSQKQPERRIATPDQAVAIDRFIERLESFIRMEHPFTFILDDPAGNSYIEKLSPANDPNLKEEHYFRSDYQDGLLGINTKPSPSSGVSSIPIPPEDRQNLETAIKPEDLKEIVTFPTHCAACHAAGEERMVTINIPYFKDVIIMSFVCDECGYRNNEIKPGGKIAAKGTRIALRVMKPVDLTRDLLKSDSAAIFIPEIELLLESGTLGGRFTTIEGILCQIRSQLKESPFIEGDSSMSEQKEKWNHFFARLDALIALETDFHIVIDDPLSNSYIQSLSAPDIDSQLEIGEYDRTPEQNQALGLDLMNTDGTVDPPSNDSAKS